jgi:hypothetical protein
MAERSQASLLVELAESVELFTTPVGDAYGRIPVGGHWETWPLRARGFRHWWARCFYQLYGHTAHAQAMQDALATVEGQALYDSEVVEVHVRVGADGDVLYLDLADERWRAVRVSREGWEVVADPAVRFRRTRGMLPLPEPVRGGDLGLLRRLVNASDVDWPLMVGWSIGALRARGPYPVMCVHGEQGSAKTTSAAMVCGVVDPRVGRLRAEPQDRRELMVSAQNSLILAFDNVSKLPTWLSDAFCRLATGGGYSTRMLYTDDEEVIFEAQRPIIVTGIEELATRGDLLDRAIVCYLPRIENYRPEEELWQEFEEARPAILGGLLDAVVCAMRHEHEVQLERVPRMADFAIWVTAAEPELGWQQGSFLTSYEGKRTETHELAIEASPIGPAIRDLVENGEFFGLASALLERLNQTSDETQTRRYDWPKSPTKLSGALRRIAPDLRAGGIEIDFDQPLGRSQRAIRIRNAPKQASQASQASQAAPETTTGRDAATLATQETGDVRPPRTAANTPYPLPGDNSFRDLLNLAHANGYLTDQERHERRLVHDLVLRAQPPAGEAQLLAEVNDLIDEGVVIERDERT